MKDPCGTHRPLEWSIGDAENVKDEVKGDDTIWLTVGVRGYIKLTGYLHEDLKTFPCAK